ncbi:MAG: glycosyltransferase family 4 protein [Candidatus Woesearchaeota archaeon]
MKILYLHQYFKTPSQPGGTRSYWIAQELISRGYDVTMIAGSENITQRKEVKLIDGIRVIYLKVPYSNKMGILQRFWSFVRFMLSSTIVALKQRDVDLVIGTSTPLTIGFPVLVLNYFKKIPYLFEVRDLWPEVPIQMGGLKNPLLKKLAIAFEKRIYKKAWHIVALSPGMKDGVVAAGTPSEKVSMIPNMAKIDKFYIRPLNTEIAKKYCINLDVFNVVYFGAFGVANGLDFIINTATKLKELKINDVNFVLIGKEGRAKKVLQESVVKFKLNNIQIIPAQPMDELSELINLCDCSIIPFKSLPILSTNSPNKLFDSLSAGKPIIVNSDGWTKDIAEKYNCGFYIDANQPEDLVSLLTSIKADKSKLIEMGKNARKLAETKYDKTILCKEFADLIEIKLKKG